MEPKVALLLIATGEVYRYYINQMVGSARAYLSFADVILWSDQESSLVTRAFLKKGLGFPYETLYRFHTFLGQQELLRTYSHVFYVDVDATFVSRVEPWEIISDGITATLHPGFVGGPGTPETNPNSTAYCAHPRAYFAGGFIGGNTVAFLKMSTELAHCIDIDSFAGIRAVHNDESHLNRYLYDNPPAKILTPAFCYPNKDHDQEHYRRGWRTQGVKDYVPKIELINKSARRA